VNPGKLLAAVALAAGLCHAAAGQDLSGPDASMTAALDQGASPEGCGTSNFPFPRPSAELLSGLGTGRNLERIAGTVLPQPAFEAQSAGDIAFFEDLAPSVVAVVTDHALGSGSLISAEGDVLTSWHVVKGYADVGIVFPPTRQGTGPRHNEVVRARVVKVDEVSDLALVKLAMMPKGRMPLRLADPADIRVGARVHALGHRGEHAWTYAKGQIGEIRPNFVWSEGPGGVEHRATVLRTNADVDPADSGGPLVGETGALLGVGGIGGVGGVGGVDRAAADGVFLAVSGIEVRAFLQRPGDRRLASATSAAAAPPAALACEVKQIYQGRSADNTGLVAAFDTRCTGRVDVEIVVPDEKSKPILLRADRNFDGKPDILLLDFSRQGHWELSFWDSDFNGAWGLVGHHPDGAIEPSFYESASAYRERLAGK